MPALADEPCNKPLQMVNTVAVEMSDNMLRAFVPVAINGTEKTFLLDTGGFASQITPTAATDLKLPEEESGGKILDMYGHAAETAALISTFRLGRLQAKNTSLLISTFDSKPDDKIVGILAADFMGKYDTELDFTGGKMNYFSTDHCPGRVIYWPAPVVAIVPMTFGDDHHIVIPVTLDGHTFRAMIDTGSPETIIKDSEARRVFGLAEAGSGDTPMKDIDGKKQFLHTFDSLEFDGVAIKNPHIVVFPNLVGSRDRNNSLQTGSLIKHDDDLDPGDPAITLGMNTLSKLHLYIAFNERKLYITPAGAPATPATVAPSH
jgi:hypothetical protein